VVTMAGFVGTERPRCRPVGGAWRLALMAGAMLAGRWGVASGQVSDVIVVFTGEAERNDFLFTPAVVNARDVFSVIPALSMRLGPEELSEVLADPGVAFVSNDDRVYKFGASSVGGDAVPYGLDLVKARGLWPVTRGAGVRVAVLDTGMDLTNADLPEPVLSASFVVGQAVQDGDGHGTHVAGTIVARDNGVGVIGAAPEVELMVGKVLNNTGGGNISDAIAGVEWAVANGARVINMSLGGSEYNEAFEAACAAAEQAGVLVVAASGNNGTSQLAYPAGYAGVMSVGAVDRNRAWASYSQFNSAVAIAGPGTAVWSTVRARFGQSPSSVSLLNDVRESRFFAGSVTGQVTAEVVNCGSACGPADIPAAVSGRIALVRRGGCAGDANFFRSKVAAVRAAGAVGVIVANNTATPSDGFSGTLEGNVPAVVVSLSQADGNALAARLATGESVVATISTGQFDWGPSTGTSMAAPHVSAVAALLFSAMGPTATPATVRQALIAGAVRPPAVLPPVTPVRDNQLGFGVLNAPAALAAAGLIVDCNGNGIGDHIDIVNGLLVDTDNDGVADVCAGEVACAADYNRDGTLNLDDLSDFITDFYTVPAVPGAVQPLASAWGERLVGLGVACPDAEDAAEPYAADAYRTNGYRVGFSPDGSNRCGALGPNLDNLSDYVTEYYGVTCP
jgi:subtilisin family serine protease